MGLWEGKCNDKLQFNADGTFKASFSNNYNGVDIFTGKWNYTGNNLYTLSYTEINNDTFIYDPKWEMIHPINTTNIIYSRYNGNFDMETPPDRMIYRIGNSVKFSGYGSSKIYYTLPKGRVFVITGHFNDGMFFHIDITDDTGNPRSNYILRGAATYHGRNLFYAYPGDHILDVDAENFTWTIEIYPYYCDQIGTDFNDNPLANLNNSYCNPRNFSTTYSSIDNIIKYNIEDSGWRNRNPGDHIFPVQTINPFPEILISETNTFWQDMYRDKYFVIRGLLTNNGRVSADSGVVICNIYEKNGTELASEMDFFYNLDKNETIQFKIEIPSYKILGGSPDDFYWKCDAGAGNETIRYGRYDYPE